MLSGGFENMVSNKNLALLLIVAVVLSLGGTLISLNKIGQLQELKKLPLPVKQTGLATYGGKVELQISSNASCTVSNNVSFGASGQPATTTTISTQKDNTAALFSNCLTANCTGIEINNTGNVNLLVNFTSNVNATGLIVQQSGLGPEDFQFKIKNGTDNAGADPGLEPGCINVALADWTNVPGPNGDATAICANLTSADANDIVTVEFNVTLESDVIAGTKQALLTVNCVQN